VVKVYRTPDKQLFLVFLCPAQINLDSFNPNMSASYGCYKTCLCSAGYPLSDSDNVATKEAYRYRIIPAVPF
jgi:hypothetical protein